jgi:hypothetical protein
LSLLTAAAVSVTGLALASALAAGGLSTSPAIIEHVAQLGQVGELSVSNTSTNTIQVTVVPRPWIQARNGTVSADLRKTLSAYVRTSLSKFSLAPGATRQVGISLVRIPAQHSLYGNIEVVGTTNSPVRSGVKVAYQLVDSLRLDPTPRKRVLRARVGRLLVRGDHRKGRVLLPVKNTGNTADPISASVRITGGGSGSVYTLGANATPTRIVPGAVVNIPLASLHGSLPAGSYRVSGSISQDGRRVGRVNSTIRLP